MTEFKLIPPYHKGDGKNFSKMIIYVESGDVHRNDNLYFDNKHWNVSKVITIYDFFDSYDAIEICMISAGGTSPLDISKIKHLRIRKVVNRMGSMIVKDPTKTIKLHRT